MPTDLLCEGGGEKDDKVAAVQGLEVEGAVGGDEGIPGERVQPETRRTDGTEHISQRKEAAPPSPTGDAGECYKA